MSIANRLSNLAAALWRHCGEGFSLPNPWHNGVFALFLAGVLAYGVFFTTYLLSRYDLINLIRDVNYDDAFYYFQLARNLAAGQFSTFDGGITQTNGYHPLWMLLITPFYWFTDPETALFGIKGFEILLIAGAVALIAAAARLTRLPWLLLFALLPLFYGQVVLFQGMETAPALFMLGLFFLSLALYARDPSRWRWLLAAVAFALPWVRLEYIAISLAATAALGGLVAWREERPPAESLLRELRSRLTLTAAAPILGAVAGILVYFAYNWLFFDGFVPVSGAMKSAWSQNLWEQQGGYNLLQNFREVLQLPVFGYELLVALEVCAYALVVGGLARRSDRRQDWLLLAFLIGVFGLAAGHLAKFVQTGLTVHPVLHGQFPWYFVPAYLMTALIIPVRCFVILYLLRRFIGIKWPQAANLLSLGVVVIGAGFLLTKTDFSRPFDNVDWNSAATNTAAWHLNSYAGVQVMNRILPEGSVVGSWDSGTIGYFSRFPVVNLDGVVNSWDYARTSGGGGVPHGTAQHPLYQQFGLTHLANHTAFDYENALFNGPSRLYGNLVKQHFTLATVAPPGDRPSDPFGQLMARLEPHLDYRSEQVSLLITGRLAMGLAADCEQPELQNNVFFFSWPAEDGKSDSAPWYPQRELEQNELGFCVVSHLLPAAAAAPNVAVELLPLREYLARLAAEQQPLIRSAYNVYLTKRSIIYVREQCSGESLDAPFLLHLYPAEPDIHLEGTLAELGYDNRDFTARQYGIAADGVCLVSIPRPAYEFTRIRTGQFLPADGGFQGLWEADTPTGLSLDQMLARIDLRNTPMSAADYLSRITAGRSPLIRSNYDVYLVGNHLIYTREQCVTDAAKAQFFLHLYQADPELLATTNPAQLEAEHRKLSFDNLDFAFEQFGVQDNGVCIVNVPLPEYDIIGIRTGQYVLLGGDFRNLWEEEVWGGGVRVGGGGGGGGSDRCFWCALFPSTLTGR